MCYCIKQVNYYDLLLAVTIFIRAFTVLLPFELPFELPFYLLAQGLSLLQKE